MPLSVPILRIYPSRVGLFHERIPILWWAARKAGDEGVFATSIKINQHTQSSGHVHSGEDTFRSRRESPAMGRR